MDNYEQRISEKIKKHTKRGNWKRTILKRANMKKDTSGMERS